MIVLLHADSLAGHVQVYCRVLGQMLLARGHRVVVATSDATEDWASRWHDLAVFAGRPEFTATKSPIPLTAEALHYLQREANADATLFIEADAFRDQFIRISKGESPRLFGRTTAIFSKTTAWYPGEDFYTGRVLPRVGPTVVDELRRWKKWFTRRTDIDRYFFEHTLIRRQVLDAIVTKDERVVAQFGRPVCWLPEIYKVFDPVEGEAEQAERERLNTELERVCAAFRPADRFIFFGAGAWYKGYDQFLEVVRRDSSAIGLHAGAGIRHEDGKPFIGDPEQTRCQLLQDGRLWESGGYIRSARLMEDLFDAVKVYVSPHRLTVSSGTMMQALDRGRPVLAPETGLVGYRVKAFNLGWTYRYGDTDDLLAKWQATKEVDTAPFREPIKTFMDRYSPAAVEHFVDNVILGES